MAPTPKQVVAGHSCRWCGGACDGRFVKKLISGDVSNRRGGPIPTAVWKLFASADMDDVEDALVAHGVDKLTPRWAAAKKNLRRVRNQYRARKCQEKVRTQLAQALEDKKTVTAERDYHRGRADRAEACLHAAPHAMPSATRLAILLFGGG